jgi:molybdopterin/thiamine biosynthesis adenylyltransferase
VASTQYRIWFPQELFAKMRARLLSESKREAFALLFGKRTFADGQVVIRVGEAVYPEAADYERRTLASLRLHKDFVFRELARMQHEGRYDTVIDVHTHPFSTSGVAFSHVDDVDELSFRTWLTETLDEIGYASIVLSQSDYAARFWEAQDGQTSCSNALVKTQTVQENWPSSEACATTSRTADVAGAQSGFLSRSVLALGIEALRSITTDQSIAVIGAGGLGSVIAENLIHSGFQSLHLIDPDRVEVTNLNRIVGAYFSDAETKTPKVDAVRRHLEQINPSAHIGAHMIGIEDDEALPILMQCDWMIVATDSHFSRYEAQRIALELGIPLISAGVNISVAGGSISDISGEVIVARYGDGLCLNCLGRIDPTLVAAETHKHGIIGSELIRRGYVHGQHVKQPAVKTLNASVGALAVDILINQYTQRQPCVPIWVYEANEGFAIYPDQESLRNRNLSCIACYTA